jgi:hypothetical protein
MAYIDKFRNRNRFVFSNDDELYEDILRSRLLKHFRTFGKQEIDIINWLLLITVVHNCGGLLHFTIRSRQKGI